MKDCTYMVSPKERKSHFSIAKYILGFPVTESYPLTFDISFPRERRSLFVLFLLRPLEVPHGIHHFLLQVSLRRRLSASTQELYA